MKECTDSLAQVMRYQNRISGPLLDRIDIRVEVPRVDYEKLSSDRMGEPSAKIRDRVEAARERQQKRFTGTNLQCNGDMGPGEVRTFCLIDDAGKPASRGDAADADECASVSSHSKVGANNRRSRGERQDRDGAYHRSDSVSTAEASLTMQ